MVSGERRSRAKETGLRFVNHRLSGKIAVAFGWCRHCRIPVKRVFVELKLVVEEETCFVLAVINFGNSQRAAKTNPELFAVGRKEWR